MWSPLAILLFVGATVAWNGPWKPNQEYKFNVHARTFAGIPDLKNQYAGLVSRGHLTIQALDYDTIVGQLTDLEDGSYHGQLENKYHGQLPSNANVAYSVSELNGKSFRLNLRKGTVQSLEVDQSMTNDQVNQLKGILSQLQIDLEGQNLIPWPSNQLFAKDPNPSGLYCTMEASVTGECETVYEIAPIADYQMSQNSFPHWQPNSVNLDSEAAPFQIFKTMNYSNCEHQRGYQYGVHAVFGLPLPSNQLGNFLSKSTTSRMVASIDQDQFTLHYATSISRVAASPEMHQEQNTMVVSSVELILIESQATSSRLPEPQNPLNAGSLVYRYNIGSDNENQVRSGSDQGQQGYNQFASHPKAWSQENAGDSSESQWSQRLNRIQKKRSNYANQWSSGLYDNFWQPAPEMDQPTDYPFAAYSIGHQGHGIQHDMNIPAEVGKLVAEIDSDVHDRSSIAEKNTLEKYNIVVDLIAAASLDDLNAVDSQLKSNYGKNYKWNIFRDAVSDAGTGPTTQAIANWVTSGRLEGSDAVSVLSNQPKVIRTPTKEHVAVYLTIVKHPAVAKSTQVHTAALFALANLVNRAYSNEEYSNNYYPMESFGPFYYNLSQIVPQEVVPYFEKGLQAAIEKKNDREILTYIRAFGNLGQKAYLASFKKYFESESALTSYQRTAAVLALDHLVHNDAELMNPVLFKIYENVAEVPETRATAALLLIENAPPAGMLQRIASFTYQDPSDQVQSIVKSSIEAVAELKNAYDSERASIAQGALKFLNPRQYPVGYSRNSLFEYFVNGLNYDHQTRVAYVAGHDSAVPKMLRYQSYHNSGGLIAPGLEVEAMVSSVRELMERFVRPQQSSTPSSWNGEGQQSSAGEEWADFEDESEQAESEAKSKYNWNSLFLRKKRDSVWDSAENISKTTIKRGGAQNIRIERNAEDRFEGQAQYGLFGGQRFLAFDQNAIKQLPKLVADVVGSYSNGRQINFNKFYNDRSVEIGFPLATGYPYVFSSHSPVFVQIDGNVKVAVNPPLSPQAQVVQIPKTANINAAVNLVYSRNQITRTGFLTPFNGQYYVAGHVRKIMYHAPLKVEVNIDMASHQIEAELSPYNANQDVTLAHFSSWPYTVYRDAFSVRPDLENSNKQLVHTRQAREINNWYGEHSTGMVFHAAGQFETPAGAHNNGPIPHFLGQHHENLFKSLFLPTQGLELYNVDLSYDSDRTTASTINFGFNFKTQVFENKKASGQNQKRSLPKNYPGVGSQQPWTPNVWLSGLASGLDNGVSTAANVWANFEGANAVYSEYEAIVGYARSSSHEFGRFHVFAKSSENGKNNDRQYCLAAAMHQPGAYSLAHSSLQQALKVNHAVGVEFKLAVGPDCNKESAAIEGVIIADQNEQYRDYVASSSEYEQCQREMAEGNYQMPACQRAIQMARVPNMVVFDVAATGNEQYADLVNNVVWSHTAGQQSRPQVSNGRLSGVLELSPRYGYFNGIIDHNNREYDVNELEINWLHKYLSHGAISPTYEPWHSAIASHSTCVLDGSKIFTFDQHVIDRSIGKCAYVMTQYVPSQYQSSSGNGGSYRSGRSVGSSLYGSSGSGGSYRTGGTYSSGGTSGPEQSHPDQIREVSIVVANEIDGSYKRELVISVTDYSGVRHAVYIIGRGAQSRPSVAYGKGEELQQVSPNDHFVVRDHGVSRLHVYPASAQDDNVVAVAVHAGHMYVYFDGETVKVQADASYKNQLRGLCGTNDQEQYTDMLNPSNQVYRDPKYFVPSWSAPSYRQECSAEIQSEIQEALQGQSDPIEYIHSTVISQYEAGRDAGQPRYKKYTNDDQNEGSSEEQWQHQSQWQAAKLSGHNAACQLHYQTQFVENNGQICFSAEPLATCPQHCIAGSRKKSSVRVHCFNKTDPMAILKKQLVQKGKQLDWDDSSYSRSLDFNVPNGCAKKH